MTIINVWNHSCFSHINKLFRKKYGIKDRWKFCILHLDQRGVCFTIQEALLSQRPSDASCLYSFNTKRQAQSFIIKRLTLL